MGATERIAQLIESLPERDVAEILDFAEFLATRHQSQAAVAAPNFPAALEEEEIPATANHSTHFFDMASRATPDPDIEAAWAAEAEGRLAAYGRGELAAVDEDEVFGDMDPR